MVAEHQIKVQTNRIANSQKQVTFTDMPSIVHYFIVVDEVGKDGFLTRKIYSSPVDPKLLEKKLPAQEVLMQTKPEKYGMSSVAPKSNASVAQHVHSSRKFPSSYISTSSIFPDGSARFAGRTVFIDIAVAKKYGAKVVTTEEIIKSLKEYKAQHPHLNTKITQIEGWVRDIDKEVLIQAREKIPAKAIYNPQSLATVQKFATAARVLQVTAIAFTAYDLSVAADRSYRAKSIVPISREVVKQAGGWGAAWVGFKIGGAAGALIGIETGPGAAVTGIVGGLIFGAAGYWGAEWALGPDRTYTGASGSWGNFSNGASGSW